MSDRIRLLNYWLTPYYPDEQDKTEIEKKWKRIAITNFLYRMSGKKKISLRI